jgi:hypothetical protein
MYKKYILAFALVAIAAVAFALVPHYSLSSKTATTPYNSYGKVRVITTTQTANALETTADIFSAQQIGGYSRLSITVKNTDATTPLTSLHMYVSDDLTFTVPTTADLMLVTSTVGSVNQSGIWTNCSQTLAANSKCIMLVPSNNFMNLQVQASATNEVTVETKITGKITSY